MITKQYKVDLHTHSIISPDGGLSIEDYKEFLQTEKLDCIAITDHNETHFAKKLHKQLGNKIIIGEEITTNDGEMIGLFLTETVPPHMTALETAKVIHEQGGLVCIPHPCETLRQGIQLPVLEKIHKTIDIVEVFNGRGRIRGHAKAAESFATDHKLAMAASSDAHGYKGLGKTYSVLANVPTNKTLITLLREGSLQKTYAPLLSFLYPTINRLKRL